MLLTAGTSVVVADAELVAGGGLTGTVVAPGGAPVAGAVVWGYQPFDRYVGTYLAVTGADGTYRIDGIDPGTALRIQFVPPAGSRLVNEWFEDSPTCRNATVVEVGAGETRDVSGRLGP